MGGSQEKQNTIDLHLQEPQMLELLGTKLLCIKCLKKMESKKDQENREPERFENDSCENFRKEKY